MDGRSLVSVACVGCSYGERGRAVAGSPPKAARAARLASRVAWERGTDSTKRGRGFGGGGRW